MQLLDYSIIALYLGAILALGFWLQRRAAAGIESYFLGNRKLPWWALGASGMASNTDLAGTTVLASLVYALGTKGFFIGIRGDIVLVMAFFMVFMGKWTRRSQAMTLAEWMHLRFGTGRAGDWARLLSASANLTTNIWIISFFAVGGGKFFGELLGIDDRLAAIATILLATIYTVVSGFQGVIWTDVFQGGLVFLAIVYVCVLAMQTVTLPESFTVSLPLPEGQFQPLDVSLADWHRLWPGTTLDLPGSHSIYNLFGVTVFFYLLKTSLEGVGGVGGYMSQRYFAAKSDREAGLLSLFWVVLLSCRMPLVTAFAVLGIHYGLTQGEVIADPELVLPIVIDRYVPTGIKGLLVACFVAAAMSTFDSVINSGAAYWVKDIYQAFLKPEASEGELLLQGRLASVGIVVLGLLLGQSAANAGDIWGWLTFAFGSGLFVPLVLRWYWWRFNGYGFAVGTIAGMVAAIALRLGGIALPEYANFLLPSGLSLVGCLLGTYLSAPTDRAVLAHFYATTRPFGVWGPIAAALPPEARARAHREHRRDLWAVAIAVPWQLVLFLAGMMLVAKQWPEFGLLVAAAVPLSFGLYWFWFRHLDRL